MTMKSISLRTAAALAFLSALGSAQSVLTTLTGGTNFGNNGGGIYFDLQVNTTVTLTRFDFLCGSNTVAGTGTLDVYVGPSTFVGNVNNAALWTLVGSVTAPVAPSTMSSGAVNTPFALGPGNYGVALRANLFSHAYTLGNGTTVPGSGTNQTFSTPELVLRAGGAQNVFLSGALFSPRVWNGAITYTLGGTPITVASYQPYGDGCYGFYRSFYELFPNPALAFDLANSSILLSLTGNGYTVTAGSNPLLPPVAPVTLTLTNDSSVVQSTLPFPILYPGAGGVQSSSHLEICSNGFISPAASNGATVTPTVAAFLNGQPRWANWYNFDPATGGTVTFDSDPGVQPNPNPVVYVTWNNVPGGILGTITPVGINTFQMAFFANGDVEYRYQNMPLGGGGAWPMLVGWTPGGGALDRGNLDLTASFPFQTNATDNAPLLASMSARPLLGTQPNFVTGNIPAGTVLGARILSFTPHLTGIELTAFGMPGCFQYEGLDVVNVFFTSGGNTVNTPFPIPNLPVLNGVLAFGQSATFSSGFNPLGVISSNGLRVLLGSL